MPCCGGAVRGREAAGARMDRCRTPAHTRPIRWPYRRGGSMNLQLPGSVRTGRLAASLAASDAACCRPSANGSPGGERWGHQARDLCQQPGVGNAAAGVSFTLDGRRLRTTRTSSATGFTEAVTISSSDTQAIVAPGSPYTYLAGDNGSKVFTVTLKTAGSRTITFSSAGLASAVATITVDPGRGQHPRLHAAAQHLAERRCVPHPAEGGRPGRIRQHDHR